MSCCGQKRLIAYQAGRRNITPRSDIKSSASRVRKDAEDETRDDTRAINGWSSSQDAAGASGREPGRKQRKKVITSFGDEKLIGTTGQQELLSHAVYVVESTRKSRNAQRGTSELVAPKAYRGARRWEPCSSSRRRKAI